MKKNMKTITYYNSFLLRIFLIFLFVILFVPSFAQVSTPLPTREGQGGGSSGGRSSVGGSVDGIQTILGLMSPSQKIAQLTGKTLFAMADDEELGIPGWLMSDGPHGVHREGYTSFPTGIAMAALWDRDLLLRLGHAMGEEFWAAGQHVGLAPCIDLCLDPRGGRTAESAGEDPYLSGQIGTYLVRGIQTMPVMACLKHFEIEGKQAYRKTCNEIISERDLMGFFGTNFRTALQEGVPLSLMSSYNLLNGVQVAANRHLLTDILRTRWGYPFTVISDWGGVQDGPSSLLGGTDVCMGSTHYRQQLPTALANGTITEANLDTAASRVLLTKSVMGLLDWQPALPSDPMTLVDNAAHRALCREAAGKAVVLLRNTGNLLPLPAPSSSTALPSTSLSPTDLPSGISPSSTSLRPVSGGSSAALKLAVIGPNAEGENLNCFGSSETQPAYAVSLLAGIRAVVPSATYVKGCPISGDDTSAFAEAEAAARAADYVIFAGGLDKTLEGESIIGVQVQDRESTALPAIQQQLIRRLAAANSHLIVVLQSGGIVSLADCIDDIPALVYSFYSGQEAGNGIADVLFGLRNPAGRLPMTMPQNDAQLPEWNDTYFTDDWGGGYRWYERQGMTPQYPFGYGLSYTTFRYDHLTVTPQPDGMSYAITADITNTGTRDGEEVAQLYIDQNEAPAWQPLQQLRGFERISIPAGQTRTVRFQLSAEDFYEWNLQREAYEVPATSFTLSVGGSSADLPLTTTLDLSTLPSAPDLRITQLFTQPRYPRVGDEVTFYAYVKNQGTAPAGLWALLIGTPDSPQTALGTSFDTPPALVNSHPELQPGQGTLLFCSLGAWTPSSAGDFDIDATLSLIGEQGDWNTVDAHTFPLHVYAADSDPLYDGISPMTILPQSSHNASSPAHYYDLSGRRLTHPTRKGLYILNGKKVLIR